MTDTIDLYLGRRPDESTEQAADRVRGERDAAVAELVTARRVIAGLRWELAEYRAADRERKSG